MRFMHSETKRKVHFSFVLPSFFRNIGFAELTWHSEVKINVFYFVLPSFFRNIGFAELTWHSEVKINVFYFVLPSFFRNFVPSFIDTAL